jgi:hypothetical protein
MPTGKHPPRSRPYAKANVVPGANESPSSAPANLAWTTAPAECTSPRAFLYIVRAPEAEAAATARALRLVQAQRKSVEGTVLYVGMNPETDLLESRALGKPSARRAGDVARIAHSAPVPLETRAQVRAYCASLGLPAPMCEKVAAAICAAESRAELAHFASVWSAAYRGQAVPRRVILSGLAGRDSIFGYVPNHGVGADRHLNFADLRELAQAMPKAAACIEHIYFAACFTYRQFSLPEKLAPWRQAFPNIRTLTGYASKLSAAVVAHLSDWRARTWLVDGQHANALDVLASGTACWDSIVGYIANAEPIEELRAACARADNGLPGLLSGKRALGGPSDPAAYAPYQSYRKLEGRPDATPDERANARVMAEQYLAIRMSRLFVARYQQCATKQLGAGCTVLGLDVPNFGSMPRAEAHSTALALLFACRREYSTRAPDDAAKLHAMEPVLKQILSLRTPQ